MPSFLDYQEKARRRTRLLVAMHLLCLAGVGALVGAAFLQIGWVFLDKGKGRGLVPDAAFLRENLGAFLAAAGVALGVVAVATLVRTAQVASGGGGRVAKSLGGRRVRPNTRDRLERRLLHVVEEMAIASRVAIPEVYVLDDEPGVNAFAAGWSPNDAAVAVTRGALESLSREELQCVVGHEFSHILNGDMRLNLRLLGSVFGLVCIAVVGRFLLRAATDSRYRSRNGRDDGRAILLMILLGSLLWLVGQLGVLFGRILQATISRQREFLADASAVQFTRNPHGMASALETIGAASRGSRLASTRSTEVAHMLFAAPSAHLLFATHPPLAARIRRFEPGFDGDFNPAAERLAARLLRKGREEDEPVSDEEERILGRGGLVGGVLRGEARPSAGIPPRAPSEALQSLPAAAFAALCDPSAAPGVLAGALLSADPAVRERQLDVVRERAAVFPGLAFDAGAWRARLAGLAPRERQALCGVALGALRGSEPARRESLAELLRDLALADGTVSPFERDLVGSADAAGAPPELREPAEAASALCGALLDRAEGAVREAQLAALRAAEPDFPGLAATALDWHGRLAALAPRSRRAWCEIAASALRGEPLRVREALAALLDRLVEADGAVTPFEFAVGRLFRNRLLPPPPAGSAAPTERAAEARTLLFALADFGADAPADRAAAFAGGLAALPVEFGRLAAAPEPALSPDALSAALDRLRDLPPAAKRGLLDACRAVVLADGRTTPGEDHALFAFADTLDAAGWSPVSA